MKLSFWQFFLMVATLVGLYYAYNMWWVNQDRNSWIHRLNSGVYKSADELEKKEEPKAESSTWP